MTDTTRIEETAKHLGELIREHPSARAFAAATESLDKDVTTQRLITDFNRHLQKLAEKQHSGKPIEVEDKHKLEQLQSAVAAHPLIARMQQSQMDYLDVLRKAMVLVAQTAGGEEAMDEGMDMPGAGAGMGLVH
ncbi:MAG: YlbF family regulator [Phycisphaerales bacterium]